MGTPEISATCLKGLVDGGVSVVGAVTGEDKIRGRGKATTPTAVKALALELGIPVYTPKTLRSEEFLETLKEINPDIIVVVAYGKILPPAVIDFAKLGCINLHVSLLPEYRGAAPMQRAIMDGKRQTGVTVMQMDYGLDTGDIISQVAFPILDDDDFEKIHDKSAEIGKDLLVKTLADIENGTATYTKQDDSLSSYAAKIERDDCKIDFTKDAKTLDCIIRGITPIPMAFAYLNGKMIKIVKAIPIDKSGEAGRVVELDAKALAALL